MEVRASVLRILRVAGVACAVVLAAVPPGAAYAQTEGAARPVFRDGQAQVVEAFADADALRRAFETAAR